MSEEYRISEFSANLFLAIGAVFMVHAGWVLRAETPTHPALATLAILIPWGLCILFAILAIAPFDPRPHGRILAGILVGALMLANMMTVFTSFEFRFGTDALLFTREATNMLLSGQNPYAHEIYPVSYPEETLPKITPTRSGGHVNRYSYPAGMILAFMPQRIAGIGKVPMHLTPFLFTVLSCFLLIAISPPEIAIVPALIFSALGMFGSSLGGIIDPIWLFPLLFTMWAIYSDDWLSAGIFYGISITIKQHPWLAGPYLFVWCWQTKGPKTALTFAGISGGIFSLVNLPFFLGAPERWISGVMVGVNNLEGGELIAQGIGWVALRTHGGLSIPKWVYVWSVILVGVATVLAYTQTEGESRWLAFVMPPVILFFHWRSLPSYLMWFIPVAYMSLVCSRGAIPKKEFIGQKIARKWRLWKQQGSVDPKVVKPHE